VNDDDAEASGLGQRGVDHSLKGGTPIIGSGIAGLNELRDPLPTLRLAVIFDLPALIGNGEIAISLSPG